MSLLFESIRCLEGRLINLEYHQKRLNQSRQEVLNFNNKIDLDAINVPEKAKRGLWKCRVSYAREIEKIEFSEYVAADPQTFKLVHTEVQYAHKFENRIELNKLFARRGTADDIIIVVNGRVTDSSYGNLVFQRGNQWLTPAQPLLPGTMCASLLDAGKITAERISANELPSFSAFMMINALNPFREDRALLMTNII